MGVLRHRDFRLITIGNVISQMGTWAQYVGTGWAASQLSDSKLVITGAFASQFVPSLVLSPVAGVVADRVDRKRLVIAGNIAMAIPPLVIGLLLAADRLESWSLIALVGAGGVGLALSQPAAMAIAPDLVPTGELGAAVATSSALSNLTRVVGPGIGGLAVRAWGVEASFYLNAASFLAVIIAALMIRWQARPRSTDGEPFVARFRHGLAYARANRAVGRIFQVTFFMGLCTMHAPLMPLIARDVLDGDVGTYSQLATAPGIGAVLGALAGGRYVTARARRRGVAGAVALVGVVLAVVATSRAIPLTFAALMLYGLGFFLQNSVCTTMLMETTADAFRGRVMGLFGTVQIGMIPVGALAGGALASGIGVPVTVGLNAAVLLTFVSWSAATRRFQDLDVQLAAAA